jgi:hypothetical protein
MFTNLAQRSVEGLHQSFLSFAAPSAVRSIEWSEMVLANDRGGFYVALSES